MIYFFIIIWKYEILEIISLEIVCPEDKKYHMTPSNSILDDFVASVFQFLPKYGWYILGLMVTIMIARPYFVELVNRISLNSSSNIKRKELLDEHRKKIREKQQEEQNKLQDSTTNMTIIKPEKVVTSLGNSSSYKNTSTCSKPASYNPLAGGGGFTSNYRPSSEMRNRGRGG